jgi:phosphoglycolate phosphatase-like HAD superfamily hydrolase
VPGIVVFDVDGTLTASTGIDDACLCAAWERVFGAKNVDTDWSKYRHSTDDGLTLEVCEKTLGRRPRLDEVERVKREFFALLHEHTEADGNCCRPVPGVVALLAALRKAGWRIGIASGAWEESARIKLRRACVDVSGFPGTFSHPMPGRGGGEPAVREQIVGATLQALGVDASTSPPRERRTNAEDPPLARRARNSRPVYVGDGPWDARAARTLDLGFIGVRLDGRTDRLAREGALHILHDFTDTAAAVALIERAADPSQASFTP